MIMGHTPYVPGTVEDRIAQRLAADPDPYRQASDGQYPPQVGHIAPAPAPVLGLQRTAQALAMLRDVLLIVVLAAVIYFGASAMYALGKARDAFNVPAAVPAATAPVVLPDVPEDCALIDTCDGWDGE
jgi:hypothetical protein